ncbi:MAG: tetratricopeptide repeat protein [Bryobacteraceae bacterium]
MLRQIRLALLVPTLGVAATTSTFGVRGEILPHRMASVQLHAVSNPFSVSALAGPDGHFRFKNIQPGTYTLLVSSQLGGESRKTVEISAATADHRGQITLKVQAEEGSVNREGSGATITAREWQTPELALREYRQAQKRISKHDFDSARQCLRRAVEIDPRFAAAWNQLGTMAYQSQRYAEAETYFRRGLEADPRAYEPLVNLGGVLLNLGKLKDALKYNSDAARRRPQDALAHSQLGTAYAFAGQLDAAEKHLSLATHLDPDHFSHPQLLLAEVYARQNQPGRAADQLQDFLSKHPEWPNATSMKQLIANWRDKSEQIAVQGAGEQRR